MTTCSRSGSGGEIEKVSPGRVPPPGDHRDLDRIDADVTRRIGDPENDALRQECVAVRGKIGD